MIKKIIKIIIPLIIIIVISNISSAITTNKETLSFINKEEMITSNFDKKYEIYTDTDEENNELIDKMKDLSKKTTYLLLGEPNIKKESSEDYYKRYKDYLKLMYDPIIPKDDKNILGMDTKSQEYKDSLLSGYAVPGVFKLINELDVKYNSYGSIRVVIINEETIMCMINLPNVKMKKQDDIDQMEYNEIQTDLTFYYLFKKLNNEYKLFYLEGETNDDIEQYMEDSKEKKGTLTKKISYNSDLEKIYDFSKAKAVTDDIEKNIYDKNKDKIVFLNSTYNMGTTTSANGFFIKEGILVTTYNYLQKSLMKAQNITVSDFEGNIYELEGIVTVNIENDIAILKVKSQDLKYIKINNIDKPKKEEAIISISSKTGVGLTSSKGIVISSDKKIQTSIPVTEEIQGSPLFNANGDLIGMANSKLLSSSTSFATNLNILKKYYEIFSKYNYNEINAVPFNTLKENYYIKYNDEKKVNDIQSNILKKFSNLENANEMIKLDLVKAFYRDGIVSLRYKNDVPNYIDTMSLASEYIENLSNKGYKTKLISDSKCIYENNKYKIIIMKEFDYLIIVMVKL